MSTTVSSAKTANTPSNPSFIPKMVSPGSSLGGPLPSEPLAPMGSMPSLASLLSSGSSCGVGKGWEMDGGTGQSSGENNSGAAGIGHHRRRVFHARVGSSGVGWIIGRDTHRWRRIGAAVALSFGIGGHVTRRATRCRRAVALWNPWWSGPSELRAKTPRPKRSSSHVESIFVESFRDTHRDNTP